MLPNSPRPLAGPARPTVLVVDDDALALQLTARFLTERGYAVLTAADGLQALELLSDLAVPVALVVSDVRMPRMDGLQLAGHLRRRALAPKLLFVSGGGPSIHLHDLPGPFLAKPFSQAALLRAVERLLGE